MKKLVLVLLILAAGLGIISGAVIAKDHIIIRAAAEDANPVLAAIGEVAGMTTGGLQIRKGDSFSANLSETALGEAAAAVVDQSSAVVSQNAAPSVAKPIQFEGSVSAVDLNDGLFDLSLGSTGVTAFNIDADTSFEGELLSFEDISSDMQVSITAVQDETGSWRVVSVVNQSPVVRAGGGQQTGISQEGGSHTDVPMVPKYNVGGRVTAVTADTLTIQTQGGTPMTFAIGESTIISSYNGTHDSLDDIQVNFTVSVIFYEGEELNGLRLAYRVVVSNEGVAFNPHAQGWVDSVGADSITITTNQGATYTFMVNGGTQVRGVGSFGEISAGDRAFIYYQDQGGTLVAKGIQIWPQ